MFEKERKSLLKEETIDQQKQKVKHILDSSCFEKERKKERASLKHGT